MATQPTESGKQQQAQQPPRPRGGSGDELAIIAQRAQAFTNASGVAIALTEGDNTEEIICRARSGSSAPEVGTALRVEGTFTGLCIQTGKELRCDDAETDTRVDMTAIRALDIRSMVVTPIREDSRIIGVLAVFAPTAHAFTITHVAVLKTMSDQISAAIQRERRTREEGGIEEPVRYAPVAMPKPVSSAQAPSPVLIKPSSTAPVARAATPAKVEPIKVSPVAAEVAAPVAFPKRNEDRPEARTSFGTLDAVAGEQASPGMSRMIIVVAAVLVVAAASIFGVLKMRTKPAAQPVVAQQVQPENPSAQNATSNPNVGVLPTTATNQAPTLTANASAPSAVSRPNSSAPANESARPADRGAAKTNEKVAADKTERIVSGPVATNSSLSHIASEANQSSPDVAPSLTVTGGTANPNALNALAQPVSGGRPSAVVEQSELQQLSIVKRVAPVYPAIAKSRRLTSTVVLEVKVGKDGKVLNPRMISGLPIFRDAAFDAVKQWVFKPARLNGQPIEQTTQISIKFEP
jgi:TonB family protein